jgi:hypothetical protein
MATHRKAGRWLWALLFLAVFLFMAYIIIQYLLYSPKDAGAVSSKLKDAAFPYKPWVYILYVHILAGSTAFVTGPFQFLKTPAGKRAKLHRRLGYVYVGAIVPASLSGAYLSYYATGGPVAGFGFLTLDILWLSFTLIAIRKVFQKKFVSHQLWMIRSYAITFVFVTFRILLLPLTLIGQLSAPAAIPYSVWASLMLNLAVAQWIIRRKGVSK